MGKVIFLILILFSLAVSAQVKKEQTTGEVTFISSQHIYLKFNSTEGIQIGDTLFVNDNHNLLPVLLVKFISSKSVAAERLSNFTPSVNQQIISFRRVSELKRESDEKIIVTGIVDTSRNDSPKEKESFKSRPRDYFYGRLSLQSVSTLDNQTNMNQQRWRYSLSLSGDKIYDSKFSFSSYMNFSYNVNEWQYLKKDLTRNLRVYDLGVKYEIESLSFIWAGRHLNPKVSNLGTMDGIQYETKVTDFTIGAMIGSRPNFYDYSFDPKLLEYGAYAARIDTIGTKLFENTFAVFQQNNRGKTDRRYAYFQHSNNIIPLTNIFLSSEIDLFKISGGKSKSAINLTSLYLSARVNILSNLSTSLSYDGRKNVIYYETYKTFLEQIIENEMRHGYVASVYYRPTSRISLYGNYGLRTQKGDKKTSQNFGLNFSYYQLPLLDLNATVNYSKLSSSYSTGNQIGLRLNKYINNDLSLTSEFRWLGYNFINSNYQLQQKIVGFELSYQLFWKMFFSINYEGTFYGKITQGRVFLDLTKRF